jgi:hypothetical protein
MEETTGPKGERVPSRIILSAEKTETSECRDVPVTARRAGVPECAASRRMESPSFQHFHDLRREFASRVRETPGNSDHEVRDLLGHANISTTSRYLGTTPQTRERAMQRFEQHQRSDAGPSQPAPSENCHTTADCDNPSAQISTAGESVEVVNLERVN